jgi:hypothetical protein
MALLFGVQVVGESTEKVSYHKNNIHALYAFDRSNPKNSPKVLFWAMR